MNTETYELTTTTNNPNWFFFTSSGPSGDTPLVIIYEPYMLDTLSAFPNTKNLGFGVISGNTVVDTHNVNNGDTEIILNTVAYTALYVLDSNPDYNIFISGSTPARTRLYQMKLNKYFSDIPKNYTIYGYDNGIIEPFVTGQTYNGFILSRKNE